MDQKREQWTSGDSDKEDFADLDELEQLKFDTENLKVGDFRIIEFKLPDVKKKDVQYIDSITEIWENNRYGLSFLRFMKDDKFVYPNIIRICDQKSSALKLNTELGWKHDEFLITH